MQRRIFLAGTALGLSALGACTTTKKNYQDEAAAGIPRDADQALQAAARQVEAQTGGRLGLAVLDTGSGRQLSWRGGERFALCSTFKTLLAAQVLQRAEQGKEVLHRRVLYRRDELVSYSPVTEEWADTLEGLSVQSLLRASVVLSDNTAANLLLRSVGGPEALTEWLRGLGDTETRLDRWEPELNSAKPGDVRDTTTPDAMTRTLRRLLVDESVLQAPSSTQLTRWLVQSRTGDQRVRAGFPVDWVAGGKTGSGERGTSNDTLIVWPGPRKPPMLVACYLTDSRQSAALRDAQLARLGAALVQWQQAGPAPAGATATLP
ncbi:class A beta-lactamase [Comamonas sp. GB3 AK4-5]